MGTRKLRDVGDWDLWLVVYAIVALSAATDMYGFQRFAPALGLPAWAGALWVIPIKFVEWKFLTFATRIFRSSALGKFIFSAPVAAWCIAVLMSMLAAQSTIYNVFASAERVRAKNVETRANLSAESRAIKAQIASLSDPHLPRPAKVVEAALAWFALPEEVRRITRDCTRVANDSTREACKEKIALRKELASAKEYERLSNRFSQLRARLEGIDIEAAEDPMPRSFEMSVGRLVKKMDGKDGIATMGMLILALVSALGPFGLDLIKRAEQAAPLRPRPTSLASTFPQAIGQAREYSAQADRAPPKLSAASAHGQSAHEPAQPTRPPAQPACEPAHGSAQTGLRKATGSAQVQPTHDRPDACPRRHEPAQSSRTRHRPRRTKRPAYRDSRVTAQDDTSSKVVRLSCPDGRCEALNAVRSFVALLEHVPSARATGSALADAYEALRVAHAWPEVARNVFGTLLKIAVAEVGGRKLKSGSQVYEGVRIPAGWDMRVAA
jgi:hypothetical protein